MLESDVIIEKYKCKILELDSKQEYYEALALELKSRLSNSGDLETLISKLTSLTSKNEQLRATIIINHMLELKVKEYKTEINKLTSQEYQDTCSSHLGEMKILKIKIQELEKENIALE